MTDETPTRRERKRLRTQSELVAATRAAIRESGVDRFSLDAVAEAVGLTKPGIYYYFRNREALLFEVMLDDWTASAEHVAAAVERTRTGHEALRALTDAYVEYYANDLAMFELTHHTIQRLSPADFVGPSEIERIRPLNDLLLGGVQRRLEADAERGVCVVDAPRRLAFVAMAAAVGILTLKSMVERAGDPLRHTDADLLQTLGLLLDAGSGRVA